MKLGSMVLVHDYLRVGFDGAVANVGVVTRVHSPTLVNVKVLADVSPAYDAEAIAFYESDPGLDEGRYCYPVG